MLDLVRAEERYGKIENGAWANETKWCVIIQVPEDIAEQWINSANRAPTRRIYCNRDMSGPLIRALGNVRDRGLIHELKTFDGCFNIRDVRGEPGRFSTHAYAMAIDINADENPLGSEPKMSPELVACFTDEGFIYGGTFKRKDGMHFQLLSW